MFQLQLCCLFKVNFAGNPSGYGNSIFVVFTFFKFDGTDGGIKHLKLTPMFFHHLLISYHLLVTMSVGRTPMSCAISHTELIITRKMEHEQVNDEMIEVHVVSLSSKVIYV